MRYRVKDYTVEVSDSMVWLYFTAPQWVTLSSDPDNEIEPFIKNAIRLVVDEGNMNVLCSSMQKERYLERAKCNTTTRQIRLCFNAPADKTLGNGEYTIEMDWGDTIADIDFAALQSALQGTDTDATLTAILTAIQGGDDPDIPEGLGDRINLLLQFFGLPESLPEYEAMTETEVKQMSDEVFAALYGICAVTATMHYAVGGNDITSTIYPKYKRMVSAGQSGSEGTSSQGTLQDVTYGQQGFTHLYKMDEDTESQTYGQYVSCLDDVPQEGDVVYYLPNYNN